MIIRIALWLALALLGSGCGAVGSYLRGSDNTIPPADLTDIPQSIPIREVWSEQVGDAGDGFLKLAPAVDGQRIYAAGNDGVVTALDLASGAVRWETDTDLDITAGVGLGSTVVLVGSSKGEVLALYRENGEEAWRAKVSSEILAPPRAAEGVAVVRSIDGKFTGLDERTGGRLWVYSYRVPILTLRGTAAPLLAQGVVITGLDTGKLLVLSLRDGAPIWDRTIAPPRGRTELDRMVDIDTEPRVVQDVLYVASYHGNITAINLQDGSVLWSRDFSTYAGLDVDDSRVYISDENDVIWGLDRRDGGTVWSQPALTGRSLSTPVVHGNYVVFGDFEGYLHWLDKNSGRLVGRVRADSDGIKVRPVVFGGVLYALGEGGDLSAFRIGGG
jgi:outer membrane protein assembly factor BamB